jgi:NNP family nitrate/nitrite transporter-like MFS transporter
MGIAGAGNSGTLIATLFGPRLAQHHGWHAVFGMALAPLAAVLLWFFLFARNGPGNYMHDGGHGMAPSTGISMFNF